MSKGATERGSREREQRAERGNRERGSREREKGAEGTGKGTVEEREEMEKNK